VNLFISKILHTGFQKCAVHCMHRISSARRKKAPAAPKLPAATGPPSAPWPPRGHRELQRRSPAGNPRHYGARGLNSPPVGQLTVILNLLFKSGQEGVDWLVILCIKIKTVGFDCAYPRQGGWEATVRTPPLLTVGWKNGNPQKR
jgi:hypothetical protein